MKTGESIQSSSPVKSPKGGAPLSLSEVKTQLTSIGEQVESLAKTLEAQGATIDCEGLYEVGSKLEHFLDSVEAEKLIGKVKEAFPQRFS